MATADEFEVLDPNQLIDELIDLSGWEEKGKQIVKQYPFDSYMEGLEFVQKLAEKAEELNHHPDIHLLYKKVRVYCWTHKKNAVTRADIELAKSTDKVFESLITA